MSDDLIDHVRALRAYGQSLCGNPTEAEDLVQETLVRAIEHADSYKPGTYMRAWLFTIMRNRFYTNRKKAAREPTGSADCVSIGPSSPATQEWHIRGTELWRALDQMPTHYREAIVLVGVIGESYIDAAEILGCDIGTVKSRISRARGLLRKAIDPPD
ncbi:MAG: sigma-70 family RNA polymerase sigma factor [Alphaproteobacteria bacterium]|nr:sigma-70 family RNA polymerase sigma factor [Alphaproteobacteria bacterium]